MVPSAPAALGRAGPADPPPSGAAVPGGSAGGWAPGGPAALGRGVVILAGGRVPVPWQGAPVVVVDEAALDRPAAVVTSLHEAWSTRSPVVVALAVDPNRFRDPEQWTEEPWALGVGFEAWGDRLAFVVWANTYDARSEGQLTWWWGRKALRLGGMPCLDDDGDIRLPDGRSAWVDGGPRGPLPDGIGLIVHRETIEAGRLVPAPAATVPGAELAPDQWAAVVHGSGPARIIAPAGSGKTRVLTERLRHLVVDRGFERETVLAVAYNVKAREEMEQRCAEFRPRVQSLNALGQRLLAEARGRAPAVLDEREVRRLVEGVMPRTPRRVNTDPIAPYLEGLAAIRLGLRDPEEVEASRDDVPGLALGFGPYRRALSDAGAVDFDDQVYGAIEALLGDGGFRKRAQQGCRHLLVDEFQDLTPAHVLLLRLLATPTLDVFGVGDDDQVIYGHAGADPRFLISFTDLFPQAASHPLAVNYRCPVAVVEGARTLLGYNRRRLDKDIRPGPAADASDGALVIQTHDHQRGATALVDTVTGWLAEPDVRPDQMAVLTRVNSLLLAPHVALAEAGVPIVSAISPRVLDRTGVRAALAYLRIGADPTAIAAADIIEVLRRPSRGLPPWFTDRLHRRGQWTLPALRAIAATVPAKDAPKVEALVDDLEQVADAVARRDTAGALVVIREGVGLGRAMNLLDGSKGGEGSSNIDDLEALEQVASLHPDAASFEPWLRAPLSAGGDIAGVTLSTIHRVKGREWDRVAVFGVTAGVLPHRLAEDVEEERRVLHVAITRGRHRVVVLSDDSRPSPFLAELAGTAPRPPALSPSAVRGSGVSGAGVAGTVVSGGGVSGAGGRGPAGRGSAGRGSASPSGPRSPVQPADFSPMEQALRLWRTERCRKDDVRPFIVLSNAVLRAVADASPTTLEELAAVSGIGPTKLELYGEQILDVVAGVSSSSVTIT
jgi:DNA helicase-2/ATP-dependent DNA helicase PcrA